MAQLEEVKLDVEVNVNSESNARLMRQVVGMCPENSALEFKQTIDGVGTVCVRVEKYTRT